MKRVAFVMLAIAVATGLVWLTNWYFHDMEDYLDTTQCKLVRTHDGDTFTVRVDSWPKEIRESSIRVRGIDTPELNDHDPNIKKLAIEAKIFTSKFLLRGPIELKNLKKDKYFRFDADVYVDGESLADALLTAKLAKRYDGKEKPTWTLADCKR